jgi:hypothetical protein
MAANQQILAALKASGGGGGGAWSPADLGSALIASLEADALSLANNDPVASWTDQTANGNSPAQTTTGKKPAFKTGIQNGKPGILFDGVDDFLDLASFAGGALSQPFSLVTAVKLLSSSALQVVAIDPDSGEDGEFIIGYPSGTDISVYSNAGIYTPTTFAAGNSYILQTCFNGASSTFRKNGTDVGGGSVGGGHSWNGLRLGIYTDGSSYPLSAYFFAMFVVNRALTSTEKGNFDTYLNNKLSVF